MRLKLLTKALSAILYLLALFFIRYLVTAYGFSYYTMEGGSFVWKSPAAYLIPPLDNLIWTALTFLASSCLVVRLLKTSRRAAGIFSAVSALLLVAYFQIDQTSSVLLQNIIIFSTLVLARRSLSGDGESVFATTLRYTLLTVLAVEALSLLHYVSIAVNYPLPLLGRFASIDQGIFYSFHVITPLSLILFLCS